MNIASPFFNFQSLVTKDLKENFTGFFEKHSCVVFCSFLLSYFKPHALCSVFCNTTTNSSFHVHEKHPSLESKSQASVLLCHSRRCCEDTGMNKRSTQVVPGNRSWNQMGGTQNVGGGGELAKRQRAIGVINQTAISDCLHEDKPK